MLKHLVLGVVLALIVTACGTAEARIFRRGGCPGGKCGAVPAKSASTQTAQGNTQVAAAR